MNTTDPIPVTSTPRLRFDQIITLEARHSFRDALEALLAGKCCGIRPVGNARYVVLFKPGWMNQNSPDFMLKWSGHETDSGIRSNQFLGLWQLVVINHRTFPLNP